MKSDQQLQAIYYCRSATYGQSQRRQIDQARRYAQMHGINIVRCIFDEGISGLGDHIEHGKLGDLLRKIAEGRINRGTRLLIECFDRLGRQAPHLQLAPCCFC